MRPRGVSPHSPFFNNMVEHLTGFQHRLFGNCPRGMPTNHATIALFVSPLRSNHREFGVAKRCQGQLQCSCLSLCEVEVGDITGCHSFEDRQFVEVLLCQCLHCFSLQLVGRGPVRHRKRCLFIAHRAREGSRNKERKEMTLSQR